MKRGTIFLLIMMLIILSLSSVNALIISEVESNPDGKDSKNEWIELFSPTEINDEYKLVNNDGDELKIKFNFVGYHIYTFDGQWLDNSDEKIYLYDSKDTLVDSTNIFDDGEDTYFTWQKCDDAWVFKNQTRGNKNCVIEETPKPEEEPEKEPEEDVEKDSIDEENNDNEEKEDEKKEKDEKKVEQEIQEIVKKESDREDTNVITAGIIKLDSKDIKSKSNTEEVDKNKFATIGLGIIAIVLFILLISQRYRQTRKNEFR